MTVNVIEIIGIDAMLSAFDDPIKFVPRRGSIPCRLMSFIVKNADQLFQ
jgi:hypothetical protein